MANKDKDPRTGMVTTRTISARSKAIRIAVIVNTAINKVQIATTSSLNTLLNSQLSPQIKPRTIHSIRRLVNNWPLSAKKCTLLKKKIPKSYSYRKKDDKP